jgi:cytidine deaminase
LGINREKLLSAAKLARERAYAPYSHFKVGAALQDKNGGIWLGCNVENAAYGCTICAERTALLKAISEGVTEFDAIAVVGNEGVTAEPCGQCRQTLVEFSPTLEVIMEDVQGEPISHRLDEMLPWYFSPARLKEGKDD